MKNCQICLRSFALTIFILVMGSGCGPILSTVLIQQAAAELEGAKAAHAEIHAPYEYTGAELYLEKAKEQQGYAEFSPAVDFAYKARELAKRGKEKALAKSNSTGPAQLIEERSVPQPERQIIITPAE